jgi:lipopolysaccharide/colanic/teichoic acid biosynthesis glycosyltransferase
MFGMSGRSMVSVGTSERTQQLFKRAVDLAFTLCATIILLPVGFAVALLVRLSSPGPILYTSDRIGRGGKRFTVYKFRSMVLDADQSGPAITHQNDRRVTRIGRLLRKTKFDEFPQVLNVLRGDMSIIGPRPEAPSYVALYTAEQRKVLQVRPGLTSLAQVLYRHEEDLLPAENTENHYIQEILPHKLALDLYYIRHWTLWLDAKVFLLGVLGLLSVRPPAFLWPVESRMPDEPTLPVDDGPARERRTPGRGDVVR